MGAFRKEDDGMDVPEIIRGIADKKTSVGMTNQQLSDASGVPKSTVDRILRGDTPNPSLQSVLDMAAAVGYQFGDDLGGSAVPETGKLDETSRLIVRTYNERIARLRAHYNMLMAEKNRWILCLFVLCLVLVALIIGILVADILRPDIGWVRG